MLITEENIPAFKREFEEQGYLILPGVLTPDRVERLNAAVNEVLAEEEESLAYNIYNSVERSSEIASLIDEPAILPLIVNMLGPNIQLHISHLTVRKPNPEELATSSLSFIDWHQDGPHPQFPVIGGLTATYYIKVCYILSDMSQPNRGNTKVIPGSHRQPYNPNHKDVRQQLEGEVQICGNPGDVFIFAQNLWHAGSPNASGYTRRQLFLGYSPIWMRPIDYDKASDRLLHGANPVRRQLLGKISHNPFHHYVPQKEMLPLASMLLPTAAAE